jgi:hypothetical protein
MGRDMSVTFAGADLYWLMAYMLLAAPSMFISAVRVGKAVSRLIIRIVEGPPRPGKTFASEMRRRRSETGKCLALLAGRTGLSYAMLVGLESGAKVDMAMLPPAQFYVLALELDWNIDEMCSLLVKR